MATSPTRYKAEGASLVSREIGLQIRARRNEYGMTQAELAKQVDVSQQQVNKYESGIGRIPAEQLMKLCRVLKIELSSLYRPLESVGFAESEQTPFVVEAFADKDTVTLVRLFQSIKDKKVRKKVLALIATMAEDPSEGGEPESDEPDVPAWKSS